MKTLLLKTLLGIVGAIVVLLVVLRITGLDPHDRIPGLWLKGTLVTAPVTDWSFTEQVQTISLQTESWYGLPHSVTTNCQIANGQLYIVSYYPVGSHKSWDENVLRDPHVRIKIGDHLYDRTLVAVTDPAESESAVQAREKKYQRKIAPNLEVRVFRVVG